MPTKRKPTTQTTCVASKKTAARLTLSLVVSRRQRASQLASQLIQLAQAFPEFRRDLQQAQGRVSWQGQRTVEGDRQAVLKALSEGCATVVEICDETGFSVEEAAELLSYLMSAGVDLVETRPQGGKTDSARGARTRLYFLRGAPAGSSFTDPSRRGQSDESFLVVE